MRIAIHRHIVAAVLALGALVGMAQAPADAAPNFPPAVVQGIQYYGPGPGYYRGPPRGYYGRPRYYGRPVYRPGPRYYGPRGGYGRPYYRGYR